ncbi:MAG: nicotinamide riboside transporter PnuC [Chloroflexales bacterium]
MGNLLDVNTIACTVLGYPLSYLELVGTLFNLWSVWLVIRQQLLTWPVGIIGVLLFMLLFYQIRLYSDTLEQIYYLVASVYGWWLWARAKERSEQPFVPYLSKGPTLGLVLLLTSVLSVVTSELMSRVHLWLPVFFSQPAAFPFLDALTTVMSFSAMWLMAQKRLESWGYWICVDVIGIGLYYVQGVRFIALLYVVLLGLAINGLITWLRAARRPIPETVQTV